MHTKFFAHSRCIKSKDCSSGIRLGTDLLLVVVLLYTVLFVAALPLRAATLRYTGYVVLGEPDGQGGIRETVGAIVIQQDVDKGVTYIQQDCAAVYSSKVELLCNGVDIFITETFANSKTKPFVTIRKFGTHTLGEAIGTFVEIPYLIACTKYWELTNRHPCEIPISVLHKDPDFGCDCFVTRPGNREGEILFWLNGTGRTKKDKYEYQLAPPYHNGFAAARLAVHQSASSGVGTLPRRVDFSSYQQKPGAVNADDVALSHRVSVIITNVETTSSQIGMMPIVGAEEMYETVDYRFEPMHGNPFFYRVGRGGDFRAFAESGSKEFTKIEQALSAHLGTVAPSQSTWLRYVVLAVLFTLFAAFILILIKAAKKPMSHMRDLGPHVS